MATDYAFYIDTDAFPNEVPAYADAEKTRPLPRVIPLVQGFRGTLRIGFLGAYAPDAASRVSLSLRAIGSDDDAVRTADATRVENEDGPVLYDFDMRIDTTVLSAAIGGKESLALRGGILVLEGYDDALARNEFQLTFSISKTALGAGDAPDPSPTALEAHNADEDAHPAIRALVDAEAERAKAAEAANATALATETSAREQGDAANATALEAETNRATSREDEIASALSGGEYTVDGSDFDDDAEIYGYYGTLAALGCTGESITPKSITLFRRNESASADNAYKSCLLRILRVVDGAWTVAYQSTNSVVAANQTVAGKPLEPWVLENTDGRGAIPASEQIAIVQVLETTASAATSVIFGCKVTFARGGALNAAIAADAGTVPTSNEGYAPAMTLVYASGGLVSRVEAVESELDSVTEQLPGLAEKTWVSSEISEAVSNVSVDLTGYATTTALAAETSAREQGDAANATALASETSAREAADDCVTTALATETAAREQGDADNATAIATETAAREAADAELASRIDELDAVAGVDLSGYAKLDGNNTFTGCSNTFTGYVDIACGSINVSDLTSYYSRSGAVKVDNNVTNRTGLGMAWINECLSNLPASTCINRGFVNFERNYLCDFSEGRTDFGVFLGYDVTGGFIGDITCLGRRVFYLPGMCLVPNPSPYTTYVDPSLSEFNGFGFKPWPTSEMYGLVASNLPFFISVVSRAFYEALETKPAIMLFIVIDDE